jgi:hypothetical protein
MSTISSSTTTTTAFGVTADTTGALVIQTGATPTTAMTIDTSQNVGIGVTPSAWTTNAVAIQGGASGSGSLQFNKVTPDTLLNSNSYLASGGWTYLTSNKASLLEVNGLAGNIALYTAPSGTAGSGITWTQVMAIEKDKSLALQNATSQTGIGISFPATQSASSDANTLDDYEEGTWTPTDNSGAGLSFTVNGATYIKIGQLVVASCQINYPSTANGNGAAIAGLPFTVASQDIYGGFTRYSTYGYVYPTLAQGGTYGSLYTTTGSQITNANLSSKRVDFTYVYRSNA